MTCGYRNSAGTDLDSLFLVNNSNAGAIGFRVAGGGDLGNRFANGSLGYAVGYKNSAGTDLGYLRGNTPPKMSTSFTMNNGYADDRSGYIQGVQGSITSHSLGGVMIKALLIEPYQSNPSPSIIITQAFSSTKIIRFKHSNSSTYDDVTFESGKNYGIATKINGARFWVDGLIPHNTSTWTLTEQ